MCLCIGRYPYLDVAGARPDPVDVNTIAHDNNTARREQVCSVVDQMISDVINLFSIGTGIGFTWFLEWLPFQ